MTTLSRIIILSRCTRLRMLMLSLRGMLTSGAAVLQPVSRTHTNINSKQHTTANVAGVAALYNSDGMCFIFFEFLHELLQSRLTAHQYAVCVVEFTHEDAALGVRRFVACMNAYTRTAGHSLDQWQILPERRRPCHTQVVRTGRYTALAAHIVYAVDSDGWL